MWGSRGTMKSVTRTCFEELLRGLTRSGACSGGFPNNRDLV
jgi:hypothetical protein